MGYGEAHAPGVNCFSSLNADLGADPGGRDRPRQEGPAQARKCQGTRSQEASTTHHLAILTLRLLGPLLMGWGREVDEERMLRKCTRASLPGVLSPRVPGLSLILGLLSLGPQVKCRSVD